MRDITRSLFSLCALCTLGAMTACKDNGVKEEAYVYPNDLDQQITKEEWYTGGKLGTTFNSSESSYEDPTPAVESNPKFEDQFGRGEDFFEHRFTQYERPRMGLGPTYTRSACIDCHPNYGHGRRMTRYKAGEYGNGYLITITNRCENPEDEELISSVKGGMVQTKAVFPFKAPLDEDKIKIVWHNYEDEWGNEFPDGETYGLIYPELIIPEDAYYSPLKHKGQPIAWENVVPRLESSIGFYGIGLLEAIDDKDILEQYRKESQHVHLNPKIFKDGEWVNPDASTGRQKRYAYVLAGSTIQIAPGMSSLFSVSNITRDDQPYNYLTDDYARTSSKDPEVQRFFYDKFPEANITGDVEKDIYNFLTGRQQAELSKEQLANFMVWFRGLAVPAARNLDDKDVQLGHKKFREIGCTACHRPSWKTGEDHVIDPLGRFNDTNVPRYPHQTIWPYTDMVQHRLFMKNNLRTGWCRTPPLWGRGLSQQNTGADNRLHDCRARTVTEAIMWHGNKKSDARWTVEKFRKLPAKERHAIVKFLQSI